MAGMIRRSSMAALMGSALLAGAVYAASAPATGTSAPGPGATTAPATGTPAGAPTAAPTTPTTTTPTATPVSSLTDAQIMAVVATVDQHEIDAATKAMKKKLGKDAKDFAKMLKTQHQANLNAGKKVAKTAALKPAANPLSDSLKAKGDADVKAMQALAGAEFEKAYIEAMVKGHTDVLALLDQQLLPTATNPDVKTFLNETRGHVAAHLEQAQRLQGAQAATTTTP